MVEMEKGHLSMEKNFLDDGNLLLFQAVMM
jgi:hypothetical protein